MTLGETPAATVRGASGLRRIWHVWRVNAWWMALVTLLVGVITYVSFARQRPTYSATAKIVAMSSPSLNQAINATLVNATPLPKGTLEGVLSSLTVLERVKFGVDDIPNLSQREKNDLRKRLDLSIRRQRALDFSLTSDINPETLNGNYFLHAEHYKPTVAAALANRAAQELVDWDAQRAMRSVIASRQALEDQVRDIDTRLRRTGPIGATPTAEQQSLLGLRADRLDELNNMRLYSRAVMGTLSVFAPAVAPLEPIRPTPLPNALLASGVALLASSVLALFRASVSRPRVEGGRDLKSLGLYEIAKVPRVQSRSKRKGTVLAHLVDGPASQATQFVRAHLNTLLSKKRPKVILVTSSTPGEGKSSVSASLAHAFATSGSRVLLVDADLHKPGQLDTWGVDVQTTRWVSLPGAVGASPNPSPTTVNTQSALAAPEYARALWLGDNLHLLPATRANSNVVQPLSVIQFDAALKRWGAGYDVVVIDSPPTLAVADSVVIASMVSGVLLVVEASRTTHEVLERTVDALNLSKAKILGAVLNKVDPKDKTSNYGYGYGYGQQQRNAPKPAEPTKVTLWE